jgi:hypothetical protein
MPEYPAIVCVPSSETAQRENDLAMLRPIQPMQSGAGRLQTVSIYRSATIMVSSSAFIRSGGSSMLAPCPASNREKLCSRSLLREANCVAQSYQQNSR